ncbi:MarR family transcriptional regulator [Kocuria flava]|uniref:MarR family winged helix-turn-helix transcriptional regulator n=1 Tax=Kocuria flava TaxID=446860 RepID=UPI001FF0F60C|nr:MarR family transcriptional regulator [Kocuria flava]MCJ8504844.1 MarR family transcriptional regulator [Kocuria flava]
MATPSPRQSGYWYGTDRPGAVEVLEALRGYRTAEQAVRRRTRESMGMGEKDVQALRHLMEADRAGEPLTPRMLATKLGISSASTTALLDRLARSGHVERRPHPTDRRSLVIVATHEADCEIRATLGQMHERMHAAAARLGPEQAATVVAFLHEMSAAVDPEGTATAGRHR